MSMSRSSLDSGLVEQGDVVFSASMPVAFQGRPEDDWTLEARHAHLIIGGQVRCSRGTGPLSSQFSTAHGFRAVPAPVAQQVSCAYLVLAKPTGTALRAKRARQQFPTDQTWPPCCFDLCAGHIREDSSISVILGAGKSVDGVHQG